MPPLSHRAPGLIGAVVSRPEVRAEIVCDGYHVHPVVARTAMDALGRERTMAITDGTAGSGLPVGSVVPLGQPHDYGHRRRVLPGRRHAGREPPDDGRGVSGAVSRMGVSVVDAAYVCATTPADSWG